MLRPSIRPSIASRATARLRARRRLLADLSFEAESWLAGVEKTILTRPARSPMVAPAVDTPST